MFEPLPAKFSFPESERQILRFWDEHRIFARSLEQRAGAERFVFYEGPPTANGLPHPGHCLTRAMKDLFPRYQTMCGKLVDRKAGWDTHGLPVEVEVCKELGIHTKEEIEAYGVEKFVQKCIESVFRYTREWEEMTRRLGFWVNLEEAYVTFHQSYVESVWWGLKTLFERGLLYQGHKVVWWWAQGGTALSAGEVGEGYRTVDDPSVYVKFPLVEGQELPGQGSGFRVQGSAEGTKGPRDQGTEGTPEAKGGAGILPARKGIGRGLETRKRRLPHWEVGGSTYFVTFRTEGAEKLEDGSIRSTELSPAERNVIFNACLHFDGERMLVHNVVVMPDHVHLLFTPLEKTQGVWWSLSELLHSIKGFSSNKIGELRRQRNPEWEGLVWQDESFDRIIRNEADFEEKRNYILTNPAKRGFADDYPWLWDEQGAADLPKVHGQAAPAIEELKTGRQDACPTRTSLLVWTTTPWTLISNHFAAVHPELEYALVYDATANENLYIAKDLVETIAKKIKRELTVVGTCAGTELIGLRYVPPFDCYYSRPPGWLEGAWLVTPWLTDTPFGQLTSRVKGGSESHIGWRVLAADFVTIDSGTGLVHEAPAFGEVDFDLLQEERQRFEQPEAIPLLCAVAPDGTFDKSAPEKYRGRWVKDCDKEIVQELKERTTPWGTPLLFHQEQVRHEYPFCPRAEDDALIQYARKSWFVRTSRFKDEFLANNDTIKWMPEHIKEGRFGDFLRNNVDWALSRERYWGTPLPIWVCEQTGKMEAIGSFEELLAKPGLAGTEVWEQAKAAKPDLPDHLRVHKPYIDAITYDSPFVGEAGGTEGPRDQGTESKASGGVKREGEAPAEPPRMRRVTEVIDCWWDAGSMPFAQWGFPHKPGSVDTFGGRFPADFISEAIDQTRGWFYGLLAINTMLFNKNGSDRAPASDYPLPYRTCIVLGHMMGEDGTKMSKRTKNYREPSYVFDHLGADAMRWYFFSAQTPWTSVRFQEDAIRDAQREFLVRLYNVFSFFNIYANIDGFAVRHGAEGTGFRPVAERSEIDRWIISDLHLTVRDVRAALDRFDNYPAAQRLISFVDALSNWYVRRSRDRFWRSVSTSGKLTRPHTEAAAPSDQDKWDAYNTLYECLTALSRLIAPFTPFFAEAMYQNLEGTEGPRDQGTESKASGGTAVSAVSLPPSVHLCDYPEPDASLIDEALALEMSLVREIASLGRAARTAAKIKVRQPLDQVEIILAKRGHERWLQGHAGLIAEELNVKNVEFTSEADHYVEYEVKPNFKAIGPKFGKLAPKIAGVLKKLPDPAAARKSLVDEGQLSIDVAGEAVTLSPEEVEIRLQAKAGWSAAQGRAGVVVLNTEITDTLRQEGVVRELIHHVQELRKKESLPYEARITLCVLADEAFLAIVKEHADAIGRECLADEITHAESGTPLVEASVEQFAVRIGIVSRAEE